MDRTTGRNEKYEIIMSRRLLIIQLYELIMFLSFKHQYTPKNIV